MSGLHLVSLWVSKNCARKEEFISLFLSVFLLTSTVLVCYLCLSPLAFCAVFVCVCMSVCVLCLCCVFRSLLKESALFAPPAAAAMEVFCLQRAYATLELCVLCASLAAAVVVTALGAERAQTRSTLEAKRIQLQDPTSFNLSSLKLHRFPPSFSRMLAHSPAFAQTQQKHTASITHSLLQKVQ